MARRADIFIAPSSGTDLGLAVSDQPVSARPMAWRTRTFTQSMGETGWKSPEKESCLQPSHVRGCVTIMRGLSVETLEESCAHMIAEARRRSAFLGDGRHPAHDGLLTRSTAISNTVAYYPGITCGREPALTRCAVTTNVSGSGRSRPPCPTIFPGYQFR